ncbi:hypothetical protein DSM112329_00202 [Paraconexibacter sp. AEG42_29]|uniref:NIPSNAP domain-containing protein n=1 Tax=Paraconexibacter sp. AEG42_29 TaxID=2997339 RepID=A0AAU7AP17_9ACTN
MSDKHDFDFLFAGPWWVAHRRLSAAGRWERFGGRSEVTPLLDGGGHLERLWIPESPAAGGPVEAFTTRLYDPVEDLWRIWWSASTRRGHLDPPMVGRFGADGVGVFDGADALAADGTARLRSRWDPHADGGPRWEQARSGDGGATWRPDWTMQLTPAPGPALVELRRYRTVPGRRDELIDLFHDELVAPQEAAGLQVLGTFTDDDEPDQFVWLRGFASADADARAAALAAFYGGPVWAAHGAAANATMLDSDDVLLLRAARADTGLDQLGQALAGRQGLLVTTCLLARALAQDELDAVADGVRGPRAVLVTAATRNAFPRLPVREGEQALVVIKSRGAGGDVGAALPGSIESLLAAPAQTARLACPARERG